MKISGPAACAAASAGLSLVDTSPRRSDQPKATSAPTPQTVAVEAERLEQLIGLTGLLAAASATCVVLAQRHSSAAVQAAAMGVSNQIERVREHTLRLLSADAIEGYLVALGAQQYLVPCAAVQDSSSLPEGAAAGARFSIAWRGMPLSCLRLAWVFGCNAEGERREHVVVLQHGEHRFGLVIDHLLGQRQAQCRPLSRQFSQAQGIASSTILGDGSTALILDVEALEDWASGRVPLPGQRHGSSTVYE